MILNYVLDGKEFEYEIDSNQFLKFVKDKLSREEIMEFVLEEYAEISDEEKQQIASDWNINNSQDWNEAFEENFSAIEDFILDHEVDLFDWFEESLTNYYYEEAVAFEQDKREYEKDPYSYFGVRRGDFF